MEKMTGHGNPHLQISKMGVVLDDNHAYVKNTAFLPDFLTDPITRRAFLKVTGASGLAFAANCLLGSLMKIGEASADARVLMADALGVLYTEPHLCVGCRRCESACTEFNLGKAQPYISNIKIARNLNFGPDYDAGEGILGNWKVRQETCKQCPDPVPCASACPVGAIFADPDTGARTVNQEACIGCKACQEACPWSMTSFDVETNTSQKCHLCGGDPNCVAMCPTGAVSYVSWVDTRTGEYQDVVPLETGSTGGASSRSGGGCFINTARRK